MLSRRTSRQESGLAGETLEPTWVRAASAVLALESSPALPGTGNNLESVTFCFLVVRLFLNQVDA